MTGQHVHEWIETGTQRKHVDGAMFIRGTPIVTYLQCNTCGQVGFRRPNSKVVYTWSQS